jgi:hypothetical protein
MNGRFISVLVALIVAAGLEADAQVITKVERRNPSAASGPARVEIAPGPLVEGAKAFADRVHVYRDLPTALIGAQYVLMSNEDKNNPVFELHLTIGEPGTLYLILDSRVGTNIRSPTAVANPAAAGMAWMILMGFTDTGLRTTLDENADRTIDNYCSIFSVPVVPGEVVLLAQNDLSSGNAYERNMYGVAVTSAPARATHPVPVSGEQAAVASVLQWTPGAMAAFHNVYLSTNPQFRPADLVGALSAAPVLRLPQDAMVPNSTYYWRVDEVAADMATVTKGDVWSFRTGSVFDPTPTDGTQWVDPHSALSWTAYQGTTAHDLYFGADRAAVERGAASVFRGALSGTSWRLPTLKAGATYFWRVDAVMSDGARRIGPLWSFGMSPVIEIIDPNLIGWWTMEEGVGTTVGDWSGHGHHAQFTVPAPAWTMGRSGEALQCAGIGDAAVCADGSFLNGLTALTAMAWVKSNRIETDKGFLIFQTPAGGDNMNLRYDAAGVTAGGRNVIKMGITVAVEGRDTILQLESSNDRQTTQWQHVALVWSSGQALKLYINGDLDVPTAGSGKAVGSLSNCSAVIIGQGGKDGSDSSWEGLIDEVRIYNQALTQEEIQALMQGDLGSELRPVREH